MSGLSQEQAVELAEIGFWENLTHRERAYFQLFEDRLCMPFSTFHEAVEKSLGRPVYTHEFGLNIEGIRKEFLGESEPPTFEAILELIPPEKRVVFYPDTQH